MWVQQVLADQVVIGAGLVGLAAAHALQQGGLAGVVVLDGEDRVAAHQSGNNSGVVHAGLYYKPGSAKAELCAQGRRALFEFCAAEGIAHERTGKVVVATAEEELPALAELERRGRANGLCLERLGSASEIQVHEPHAAGMAGLWVPETGIVDYPAVAAALRRNIESAGGEVRLGARVLNLQRKAGTWQIETSAGRVLAKHILNCAGAYADRIARWAGARPKVAIVPFRGEYHHLSQEVAQRVKGLIYPVPDARFPFLGVHLTRRVNGLVEAGPNAVLALSRKGYRWRDVSIRDSAEALSFPGTWRLCAGHFSTGLAEVHRSLSRGAFARALARLLPGLEARHLRRGGAGVRAQALQPDGRLVDDFLFEEGEAALHVLCAPSPAATACLAIGGELARRVQAARL